MTATLTIPSRYNGPPSSANGGYACGRVAAAVDAEEVAVSLRAPPPLDQPLELVGVNGHVELRDGGSLVAEAAYEPLMLDVPDAVSPDAAAAASEAGREQWAARHPFPSCLVCGPERDDGLGIFPGALGDGRFAAPWTPAESLSDGTGAVRPEFVWAALDCPTSAPVVTFGEGPPHVLARLTARIGASVRVGERHSIVSWPLGVDGRKRSSACALYDSEGRLLAASRALWIELRS